MTTITRRHRPPIVHEVSCELRFTDGLVVEATRCPQSIHARGHWRPDPDGGDRGVCTCTHPEVDPS